MDLGLKGKVALVAASSRGLGRAVAEELAAEGASLVLCARDAQALAETKDAIERNSGAQVLAVPADVAVASDVKRVVDSGVETIWTDRYSGYQRGWTTSRQIRKHNARAVGTGDAPHALQCYRIDASCFAGHERARLGPHPEYHVHRREAASGEPDPLE